MADSREVKFARLAGIRQGLVLAGVLVILVWVTWQLWRGVGPASWPQIAAPIFAVAFLLDAFIQQQMRKRRAAVIFLLCALLFASMTIYVSTRAAAPVTPESQER